MIARPEGVRVAGEPLREDGALQDVEGDAGHLEGDVERALPAGRRRQRRTSRSEADDHRRHEARDVAGRKQRRQRPALQPPFLALGRDEPVAEPRREDAALQIVLAVIGGVVDKDVTDRGGIADDGDPAEHSVAGHDRLFEMLLASRL